jgi:predicted HTH transcriptional regulator
MKDSMEWNVADVRALITNQVQESLTLDYKRSDSLDKADSRKRIELSKDVSAFANSAGGVILYGMVEDKHLPTGIDAGIDPSLSGILCEGS